MPDDNRTKIKIIAKAVAVLKSISEGSSRLSNIARDVSLSKNQVFRILYSLREEGIIIQDPVSREYFMGPRLFEFTANPLRTHENLINMAYVEMENLKQTTGETVRLDIKFGMEKIILRQLTGTHHLTYIGKTNPIAHLWEGSVGKVLLGQLNDREVDAILDNVVTPPDAPRAMPDKATLKQQIREVMQQGYATSFGELDQGVASLATPVMGYVVPAALTIIGAEDRMKVRLDDYIAKLKAAAQSVSHKLKLSQHPRR